MKTRLPENRISRRIGAAPGSLSLFVIALAVFLLFRPYQGIVHDARLYVGYAMAAIDPDGIGRDIVFVNDGQSKFSVYPVLMRVLAESIGPSRAAFVLTYAGLVLWFVAFVAFVRALIGDRMRDTQIAAVIMLASSLPAFYGGQGVFRFAEHFATPRVFAEACVLAAFAALLSRRLVVAVGMLAIGVLFHPLMTAPAIGIAVLYRAKTRRARSLLYGVAVIALAGLVLGTLLYGAAGSPFARFDAEWMAALNTKKALVFLRTWTYDDAVRILLHLVTIVLALPVLNRAQQRIVAAVIVAALGGVLLSALGADVAGNVLVTQVQPWRGLWIVATIATISLPLILYSVWSGFGGVEVTPALRDLRRASSLLLLLAWQLVEINSMAVVFVLLAAFLWQLPNLRGQLSLPPRGPLIISAIAFVMILGAIAVRSGVTLSTALSSPDSSMHKSLDTIVATGLPSLLVIACFARSVLINSCLANFLQGLRPPFAAAALVLLTVVILDSRSNYRRYVERELDARASGVPAPLQIPRGSTVFWADSEMEAWAFAGAPGWGTGVQGIPFVFDRELAIGWADRATMLKRASLQIDVMSGKEASNITSAEHASGLASICIAPDAPNVMVVALRDVTQHSENVYYSPQVPRLIYPQSFGRRWTQISTYAVVRC